MEIASDGAARADTADGADEHHIYPVTEVAGHNPSGLDDFVGATTVTVENQGQRYVVVGAGTKHESEVLFYQKDFGSASDDSAVWKITEQEAGAIVAEPPAAD